MCEVNIRADHSTSQGVSDIHPRVARAADQRTILFLTNVMMQSYNRNAGQKEGLKTDIYTNIFIKCLYSLM